MFEQTTTKTVTFKGLKRLFAFLAVAIGIVILPPDGLAQKRIHSVFFDGTDHELHVYRIYGKIPGKTLLVIGGIQGDEPGGFLSADHYADISLAKGNLIVVPRANFRSIILKRRKINEDMNRKFAEDLKTNYETKIVAILKRLIMESDCLLNLHDGSGFFSEKWESSQRNPKRYGQSIIADTEVFVNPKTGESINLGEMAKSVVEDINIHIENRRHHFHFNNHRTSEKSSLHKEQRKSATYYALNTHGIPAFGIETSKSLSLEMKVRHHNLAINAFMDRMNIVLETPGINLDQPKLRYLVVSINDALPVVVKNEQVLYVKSGDEVMISHIEANYERGLTVDIINYGSFSDMRKKVKITAPTKVVVRKDYYPCGSINISIAETSAIAAKGIFVADGKVSSPKLKSFKIKINNKRSIFNNYEHVTVFKGDTFEIIDVISEFKDPVGLIVNFKGFVGDTKYNTGEDRGYVIKIDKDLWKRYSVNKRGRSYQIVVTYFNKVVGKLFVDLKDPV